MKKKYILLSSLLSILTVLSMPIFADDTSGVPLNQYGAVNAEANVPMSAQVPPAPSSLILPEIVSAAEIWKHEVPPAPKLNNFSYILMDAKTGNILADKKPNARIAPASLTKLMLMYIVEQQLANKSITLDTEFRVPTVAWATGGSRAFLKDGSKVTVRDLISGVIVSSGNDAAVTLATNIAGTQEAFVSLMNHAARTLGMTNTHFSNVMGLPAPNLYTSAYDFAILARHVIYDFPQYYLFYKQKFFSHNGIKQPNFNRLLFLDKYADGLKTGSTSELGFSLVASAKQPNAPRLISVVMAAPNQTDCTNQSYALMRYGSQFFTSLDLYKKGTVIQTRPLYKGVTDSVNLIAPNNIIQSIPTSIDQKKLTYTTINKNQKNYFIAPIQKGAQLATLNITYDGHPIAEYPLVAQNNHPSGGWFKRLKDSMKLWF